MRKVTLSDGVTLVEEVRKLKQEDGNDLLRLLDSHVTTSGAIIATCAPASE